MKFTSILIWVAFAAVKLAAICLILGPALILVSAVRDSIIFNGLIAIGAFSASSAVLLVNRNNILRVLINVPIILGCTLFGLIATAQFATEPTDRSRLLIFLGGSAGAIAGYILVAAVWTIGKRTDWWQHRREQ